MAMMEGLLQWLLIWALLMVDPVTCICVKDSDELSFSRENSEADDVRKDHFVNIHCCANNFVGDIKWFRQYNGTMTVLVFNNERYTFKERQQVLEINKALMLDNGTYVCVAHNTTHNVSFQFELYVAECDKAAGKVIVERMPEPKQMVRLGQTKTLECRGYFGCSLPNTKSAFWMRRGKSVSKLEGDHPLFSVEMVNKSNGNILGSILTFKTITKDNMTSSYMCYLFAVPPNGKSFHVQLVNIPQKEVLPRWGVAVVAVVSVTIVVALLLALLIRPWKDQLLFRMRTKFHCLPLRQANKRHDLIVLCHPDNDDEVRNHITSNLRNDYAVFFPYDDIQGAELEAPAAMDALTSSSFALIYLTPSDSRVPRLELLMDAATNCQGGTRIILIHNGPLRDSLQGLEPGLRSRLRLVHHIKWPSDIDRNARVKKNFICAIQSYLPESVDDASESSTEPLLNYSE
ncbi:uncharacterized protein [Haliotis cracherodii]|uniref:uncharacterized protein isoform X2 n=1 Tax=Haliotis cracherodii TaxID=6455 RepID=UPI0039E9F402